MHMDLEAYLVGVVAAEMPASFEPEALKAQAVAARTYTLLHIKEPGAAVLAMHPDAQLTTSPKNSQAWYGEHEEKEQWGEEYEYYLEKVKKAVEETKGEALFFQNQLIEPLYHASCGGNDTENSEEVWGNPVPYLKSVSCKHGTDMYTGKRQFLSWTDFCHKLGVANTKENHHLKELKKTPSGRVRTVKVGRELFKGTELRDKLGLKSTLIQWKTSPEGIWFQTDGFGHGVGLCQYGAQKHAGKGKTYQEILSLYYLGTTLKKEY